VAPRSPTPPSPKASSPSASSRTASAAARRVLWAKVLFTHGDRDGTCPISSARQAYRELPAAEAFLTFHGAGHSNYFGDHRTVNTFVDWMRWSLYGDTAARDRLRADATSSTTTWESALS
jgi:pimeloyl-ACP methyl ester carboxylesterase